jgi:hypothetical protein
MADNSSVALRESRRSLGRFGADVGSPGADVGSFGADVAAMGFLADGRTFCLGGVRYR